MSDRLEPLMNEKLVKRVKELIPTLEAGAKYRDAFDGEDLVEIAALLIIQQAEIERLQEEAEVRRLKAHSLHCYGIEVVEDWKRKAAALDICLTNPEILIVLMQGEIDIRGNHRFLTCLEDIEKESSGAYSEE